MDSKPTREKALEMVKEEVETENLRKHMKAVAKIMEKLAGKLDEDPEKWYRVGLLHDIDYDHTKKEPEKHALKSAEMLEEKLPKDELKAIKSHNHQHTDIDPESKIDKALIASDAVSGLIIATALVMPNKKIEEARKESVLKKFDDSSFAKNIDRERIMRCEEIGLEKEEFIELSLKSLKEIDQELGL